jgi:hypothetical protein
MKQLLLRFALPSSSELLWQKRVTISLFPYSRTGVSVRPVRIQLRSEELQLNRIPYKRGIYTRKKIMYKLMWIRLVCIATDINQSNSGKMFPCFVMPAHRAKSKFYCTAKLIIRKWLNILFPFAFPSICSHEQMKYIIVLSQ